MLKLIGIGSMIALAVPAMAAAQTGTAATARAVEGTRLDVTATGTSRRVPDRVRISAGVATRAQSAVRAMRDNSAQMNRVRAALRQAGVAERDIQTGTISLAAADTYPVGAPAVFQGYNAVNSLDVMLGDVPSAGPILDSLVAAGVNRINGPRLDVSAPEPALDEARTAAIAIARTRADLYARALGMRVVRVIAVSEAPESLMPFSAGFVANEARSSTRIDAGEQLLQATVTVSFELR
jgi:uncharacterized protein YggE